MSIYLCHEEPTLLEFETEIVGSRPGAVLLARSALHPGGGGQVSDRGSIEYEGGTVEIVEVRPEGSNYWHVLGDDIEIDGPIRVTVDGEHRSRVAQLHTDTHILNALVYDRFHGALVTGAQIYANGTARMDFDLPDADNNVLRGLEGEINDIIRQGVEVRTDYVPIGEAAKTHGLIRSAAVAPPPTPDGRLRIVHIVGVDRQACGGTHVSNTAESAPIRIRKVENKGRHNRRVRIELADP